MSDAEAKANYQVLKIVRRARAFTRPYANDLAIWRTQAVRMLQSAESSADEADRSRLRRDVQTLMAVVLQRHAVFSSATQEEAAEVQRNEMVATVDTAFITLTEGLARLRSRLDAASDSPARPGPRGISRIQQASC